MCAIELRLALVFDQPMDPATTTDADNVIIRPCEGQAPNPVCGGTALDPADLAASLDASGMLLTITFPGLTGARLPNQDRYTVELLPAILDAQLDALGGDRVFDMRALEADVNGDGLVDALDQGEVLARQGLTGDELKMIDNMRFDVNASGTVDFSDYSAVISRTGNSAP